MDPLQTETAEFWKNVEAFNNVETDKIETEVFRLPATCFAEETGSFTNSSRLLQWHQRATEPPGEAKTDAEIMSSLFMRMRDLYKKDGGAFPDAIVNLAWPYSNPNNPAPDEVAREFNGKALADVLSPPDPKNPKEPPKVLVKGGEQLPGFAMLRDDGSTSCGNWLYCGSWSQAGNNMARRDTSDPSGLGVYPNWGFSWPANRRVLYNRAGADPAGKPWDPKRKGIAWNGTAWAGTDVPDIAPALGPDSGAGPFIMTPEGVARLFAVGLMAEGPFPEHYEPFETPVGVNLMCPNNAKAVSNPAARVYKGDMEQFGKAAEFPYAATTYRLTEHHHFWTKNSRANAATQPAQFVEIGDELAKEKGIANGQMIKVRSNRGEIKAVAVVTRRIKALDVNGKKVHTVGIPIHWGFVGVAKNGFISNTLTPYVGDANSQTPEFKAFLVNIEKA
jgi:formate dehydrogenase major subunit